MPFTARLVRNLAFSVATLAIAASPAWAQQDSIRTDIAADMDSLMEVYRDLHANPELSFQEVRTAKKLAEEARKLGFAVTEGVGRTGVVAVMKNGPGPVVMLRADMDGLPVIEQTGLAYASKVRAMSPAGIETGVMHACGHDTHMTGWLATARQLAKRKASWSGTLVMVLQPAEEIGSGAVAMLDDGLFTRFPKPQYVLGFHDAAQTPAGVIGYTPGFALANVDSVDIKVRGLGGHGAYPQSTRDPIVLAARIVTTLQTLISRELDPQDAAVVTVGSFQAGAKHNIISDEATLLLTVRSYSDATRAKILDGIKRVARGEAIAAGVPDDRMPVVTMSDTFTPAVFNSPEFTNETAAFLKARFGDARVVQTPPSMGGEDFSRFYRADPETITSMIFWVGGVPQAEYAKAKQEGIELPSLHSPFWAPEADTVIATAAEAMTAMTLKLMDK